MTWQTLEEIDTRFSGYAWICFQNQYTEGKPWWPAQMCRIWTHQTSKTKWWTGWDLKSDEALNLTWAPCRIMPLSEPEKPE